MPSAKTVTMKFVTTSDDKDWNTQVLDRLVVNGVDVATLSCCSADRNGDHWDNNSTHTAPMQIVQTINKGDLPGQTLVLGMLPVGNDRWIFIPTLIVQYDDNSTDEWTFQETTLVGDNNYVSTQYTIPTS